jgi:hypothetical protein
MIIEMRTQAAVRMATSHIIMGGITARGSAFVAAKRQGVRASTVIIQLPPMRPLAWRMEPDDVRKVRPTSRPVRALNDTEEPAA